MVREANPTQDYVRFEAKGNDFSIYSLVSSIFIYFTWSVHFVKSSNFAGSRKFSSIGVKK